MKLVEILARELEEWPVDATSAEQDHDKEVRFMGGHGVMHKDFFARELAEEDTDHSCSDGIPYAGPVTQEMWQAERDRIAGVTASSELQPADGPLDWRDRIREIDAQQAALTGERAELVAKLAAEGLALCGEPIKAATPAEDMSDPSKWKEGDLIEIIGDDSHHFEVGEIVRLQVFEDDRDGDGHRYEHLDRRDYWWVKDVNAKFHSRP